MEHACRAVAPPSHTTSPSPSSPGQQGRHGGIVAKQSGSNQRGDARAVGLLCGPMLQQQLNCMGVPAPRRQQQRRLAAWGSGGGEGKCVAPQRSNPYIPPAADGTHTLACTLRFHPAKRPWPLQSAPRLNLTSHTHPASSAASTLPASPLLRSSSSTLAMPWCAAQCSAVQPPAGRGRRPGSRHS